MHSVVLNFKSAEPSTFYPPKIHERQVTGLQTPPSLLALLLLLKCQYLYIPGIVGRGRALSALYLYYESLVQFR